LLSLTKIIKAFEAENFPLEEDRSKSPADYDLNGVEPAIYGTGENKDLILIYNFKSYSEKEKILDETDKYNNHFSYEEFPFHAKNSLIVFRPSEMAETEEGLENITKTRSIISRIVFEELNEGKERVYKGKSENWEGTYTSLTPGKYNVVMDQMRPEALFYLGLRLKRTVQKPFCTL